MSTTSSSTVGDVIHAELLDFGAETAEKIVAFISDGETSSVHSIMKLSMLFGIQDKKSASLCILPGLYFMQKLKSASEETHLCPVAVSFAVDMMYVKGLLSVYTINSGAYAK